jgi:hypothetical protein
MHVNYYYDKIRLINISIVIQQVGTTVIKVWNSCGMVHYNMHNIGGSQIPLV